MTLLDKAKIISDKDTVSLINSLERGDPERMKIAGKLFLGSMANQLEEAASEKWFPSTLFHLAVDNHAETLSEIHVIQDCNVGFDEVMLGVYKLLYEDNAKVSLGGEFNKEIRDMLNALRACYAVNNELEVVMWEGITLAWQNLKYGNNPIDKVGSLFMILSHKSKSWTNIFYESQNQVERFSQYLTEWFSNHPKFLS